MTGTRDLLDVIHDLRRAGVDDAEISTQVWREFGQTRAVLILDSAGFTRVTYSHGIIHYLALVARLREILAPLFARHGALSVRGEADDMYAEFPDVLPALDAAVDANAAVAAEGLMLTSSEPFGICIGIGYGDMLVSESEGLFGAEMNVASKLGEDIAEPREILLSAAAHARIPSDRQAAFEERFAGISGNAISYFWRHWH